MDGSYCKFSLEPEILVRDTDMASAFQLFVGSSLLPHIPSSRSKYTSPQLESIAGVPGFTAAMIRHLHSLRLMR